MARSFGTTARNRTAALPGFTDDAPTRITAEFIVERDTRFLPLSTKTGTRSSPSVSTDNRGAVLTRRRYAGSARETVPNHLWAFERIDGDSAGLGGGDIMAAEQAIVECPHHIHMFEGFRPGWIYELEYDAHDALALDMGFVLLAETVAWLRHDAASPLRVQHTIGWGRSQSGRAIRDFIWRGFNRDHAGRRVFDGMLPHISGGGKTNMNRFSNLVVAASRQHEDHLNPSDRFPFSYAHSTDHLTGRHDAILKRPGTDPLVIHTQTASEYWHRRGSLVHTDTAGNDLPQPDAVRIHLWLSSQHWSDTRAVMPVAGHCRDFQNNVVTDPFFAGTLAMMHRWIARGVAPPPSQIPTRANGTLITVDDYCAQWPAVPGAILPRSANRLFVVDYGPDFHHGAAPQIPPKVNKAAEYTVLVPAPDEYGNDAAGLRAPMVEVPLGTYTGWSIRRAGHGHGALFSFMGSYFPFPETPEEAAMTSDPRPAIVQMFPTADDYARAVTACVERLQHQGFIDTSGAEKYRRLASDYGAKLHVHRL